MTLGDTLTTGSADLRTEVIDRVVKGFALRNYIFKDSLIIDKTNAWKNTFSTEGSAELTGGTGSSIKGVPRGANFPYVEPNWVQSSARLEKYAAEGTILWEDEITNDVPVISRTLLRIARAVTKTVDDEIFAQVVAHAGNEEAIDADSEWNSATIANRDPIQDLLNAIARINKHDYDVRKQGGELWLNNDDYANLLGNNNVKNAGQFYTKNVTRTGTVEFLLNLRLKVSNSVTDDNAVIVIPKLIGTWKAAHVLSVETINDPLIKKTIRAVELGVTQITNRNAICIITNTKA